MTPRDFADIGTALGVIAATGLIGICVGLSPLQSFGFSALVFLLSLVLAGMHDRLERWSPLAILAIIGSTLVLGAVAIVRYI